MLSSAPVGPPGPALRCQKNRWDDGMGPYGIFFWDIYGIWDSYGNIIKWDFPFMDYKMRFIIVITIPFIGYFMA